MFVKYKRKCYSVKIQKNTSKQGLSKTTKQATVQRTEEGGEKNKTAQQRSKSLSKET